MLFSDLLGFIRCGVGGGGGGGGVEGSEKINLFTCSVNYSGNHSTSSFEGPMTLTVFFLVLSADNLQTIRLSRSGSINCWA